MVQSEGDREGGVGQQPSRVVIKYDGVNDAVVCIYREMYILRRAGQEDKVEAKEKVEFSLCAEALGAEADGIEKVLGTLMRPIFQKIARDGR